MSIKEFLKILTTDPEAKELLKARKEQADGKEAIAQYAEIAKELGLSVSQEELETYLKRSEKVQQKLTEQAGNTVKEALSDENLEEVAGGAIHHCEDTYAEGEWCWVTDSCWLVISWYDDPKPKVIIDYDDESFESDYYDDDEKEEYFYN